MVELVEKIITTSFCNWVPCVKKLEERLSVLSRYIGDIFKKLISNFWELKTTVSGEINVD